MPRAMSTTLTVSALARDIQRALDHLGGEVWVEGELHSLRRSRQGHVWFDLVEPGTLGGPPIARLSVALFDRHRRGVNAQLRRTGGVRMTDGMAIRIRAGLEFYAPQGKVQLVMTGIDPEYTLGHLSAARERVLRLLADDGLLTRNGRLVTPPVPLRVGLVTAADSAAYADFVHELTRSRYSFQILHHDARVQGYHAEATLVRAVRWLASQEVDVIALVRGGGARTDLACFDGEQLARAIAAAPVPVHTGIGHETDRSIADEVAHTAHKTPTACAAALVAEVTRYLADLDGRATAIARAARHRVSHDATKVDHTANRVTRIAGQVLERHEDRLATCGPRLSGSSARMLARQRVQVDAWAADAVRRATDALDWCEHRLAGQEVHAQVLDPHRLLARGWSITRTADGRVADLATVAVGAALTTQVAGGRFESTVTAAVEDGAVTSDEGAAEPVRGEAP